MRRPVSLEKPLIWLKPSRTAGRGASSDETQLLRASSSHKVASFSDSWLPGTLFERLESEGGPMFLEGESLPSSPPSGGTRQVSQPLVVTSTGRTWTPC